MDELWIRREIRAIQRKQNELIRLLEMLNNSVRMLEKEVKKKK